jgi:hypothetical protein
VDARLEAVLASRDTARLEDYLVAGSGLPGPRLNLRLVGAVAAAVGTHPDVLEPLLPRWLAIPPDHAPVDDPRVILPCAAAAGYGELAVTTPDRFDEVDNRLYSAATDDRWRVREAVTLGLQRMLRADWDATAAVLLGWADDEDPLVVRAAAAGVAEPPLLKKHKHATAALEIQRRAAHRLHAVPAARRRTQPVRVLRQALGFTISVVVAATGDFALLRELAGSGDADLEWVVRENLKKSRLSAWPDEIAALR